MKLQGIKYLTAIALLLAAGSCPAVRLSLEECFELAEGRNPSLRAAMTDTERAATLVGTAFDAPNTGIQLSQDATDGGGMENGLTFSQEFEFPTIYVARRRLLKAEHTLACDSLNLRRTELRGEIASAYYSLLYCHSRVDALRRQSGRYAGFVSVARARYEAGETSRLECLNAENLFSRVEMELRNAETLERNKLALLSSLIGVEGPVDPVEDGLPVLDDSSVVADILPEESPVGALAAAEVERSRRSLGLARQEFLPGLFVSATSQLLISGFNPYHVDRPRFTQGNFMGFQVGVTVPLFFGAKRARLLAAGKELESARLRQENAALRLRADYAEAHNDFLNARTNLRYLENTGLERANEMARLAAVSYELGEIDYMEFMQNLESAAAMELDYLEGIESFNQAVIRLHTLKGTL